MISINKTPNSIAKYFIVFILLILSFFVGYTQNRPKTIDISKYEKRTEELEKSIIILSKDYKKIEDLGLYIPNPDDSEICKETHPIKVKLEKGVNKYYLPENKNYKRTKADICLKEDSILKTLNIIKSS
ncbi:MAG: hypothetical protein ACRCXZ_04965 [Patescibacteria group bacterium]